MEIPRFHELEYEALHNEIRSNHDRIFNVIVYVAIANGFIAAWILQENIVAVSSSGTIAIAAFIPFILTIFAFIKVHQMISRSIFVYSYLDKVEKKFGVEELGFQIYYKANREGISSVSYVWNNYAVLAIQLLFFLVFASLSTFGLL